MGRLDGKIAIITGAAGGQGRVACKMFTAEGASVLASDVDPAVGSEIRKLAPGKIAYADADLTSIAGISKVVDAAVKHFGRIDVLYSNHGIIVGKPFLEITEKEWDRVQNVDLKSVYFLIQRAVPVMNPGGSVIIVSSAGGLVGIESMSAYCAAKGGLVNLTRCLAIELWSKQIRVNALCPGVIDTPMPREFVKNLPNREELMAGLAQSHIIKRLGQPHEVVSVALFLASDESSFMTGSILPVDGGMTAF